MAILRHFQRTWKWVCAKNIDLRLNVSAKLKEDIFNYIHL